MRVVNNGNKIYKLCKQDSPYCDDDIKENIERIC